MARRLALGAAALSARAAPCSHWLPDTFPLVMRVRYPRGCGGGARRGGGAWQHPISRSRAPGTAVEFSTACPRLASVLGEEEGLAAARWGWATARTETAPTRTLEARSAIIVTRRCRWQASYNRYKSIRRVGRRKIGGGGGRRWARWRHECKRHRGCRSSLLGGVGAPVVGAELQLHLVRGVRQQRAQLGSGAWRRGGRWEGRGGGAEGPAPRCAAVPEPSSRREARKREGTHPGTRAPCSHPRTGAQARSAAARRGRQSRGHTCVHAGDTTRQGRGRAAGCVRPSAVVRARTRAHAHTHRRSSRQQQSERTT